MLLFMALARPAVRMLSRSAAVVLRGFDIPMSERAQVHSPEELKLIATAARRMGLLPKFQETLIHRALELDDVPVREISDSAAEDFFIAIEHACRGGQCARVIEMMHSRVPVYDEDPRAGAHRRCGLFKGPVAADVLSAYGARAATRCGGRKAAGDPKFKPRGCGGGMRSGPKSPPYPATPFVELRVRQVMRDVLVVPETKTVLDLIRDFQQRRRQMAIVVDEYGSTVGLVTAEDAIEQLTGELEDEFDDPARPPIGSASGVLLLDGGVNLRDLETQMQWRLPREGGVETLAGFVLMRLGHIPRVGESVDYQDRRFTVMEMDGRRISKIRVEPLEEQVRAAP